jgi:hypothetical protein
MVAKGIQGLLLHTQIGSVIGTNGLPRCQGGRRAMRRPAPLWA